MNHGTCTAANPGDPEKGERSSLFRVLARTPFNWRCFTNGWRNKIKKGEGKKKKEEKRETIEDIGTNTVCC
jgi:hypothetical protein